MGEAGDLVTGVLGGLSTGGGEAAAGGSTGGAAAGVGANGGGDAGVGSTGVGGGNGSWFGLFPARRLLRAAAISDIKFPPLDADGGGFFGAGALVSPTDLSCGLAANWSAKVVEAFSGEAVGPVEGGGGAAEALAL